MTQIDTACEHTKIRLIAAAIGHQQCTRTAASMIPLPGTDRVIAIGTAEEVARLLPGAHLASQSQAAQPSIDTPEFRTMVEEYEESSAIGKQDVGLRALIAYIDSHLAGQSQATKCPTCFGRGYADAGDPETGATKHDYPCMNCAGTGQSQATRAVPGAVFNIIPTLTPEKEAAAERGFCPACNGADLKLINRAEGMRFFQCPKCKDITVLRDVAPTAQEVTQQAAKAETAEQTEGTQANVLPPFAAPAGQHDAVASVLSIERIAQLIDKHTDRDFGLIVEPFARAIEAEVARRFRAQGGNTNDKGSDLAPTTSTVSAPPAATLLDSHINHTSSFLHGTVSAPEEVRDAALGDAEDAIDEVIRQAEDASESAESLGAYRCRDAIRAMRTTSGKGEAA